LIRGEDACGFLRRPLRKRPARGLMCGRRRRSNRPGNSQANGPQGDETLESRRDVRPRLTEDVTRIDVPLQADPGNLSGSETEGAWTG
jgi:hypothetical protein